MLEELSPEEFEREKAKNRDRMRISRARKLQKMSPEELQQLRKKQSDRVRDARLLRKQKLESGDIHEVFRQIGKDIENISGKFIPYRADDVVIPRKEEIVKKNDSLRTQEANERRKLLESIMKDDSEDDDEISIIPNFFEHGKTYFGTIKNEFMSSEKLLKEDLKPVVDSTKNKTLSGLISQLLNS